MDAMQELLINIDATHSLYLQYSYNFWIKYALYTWKWWLLIFILIVPWFFWWKMIDKKRILEVSFYGALTFIAVLGSDAIGVANGYWSYPIRLAPKFPHILPVDTSIFPVTYMLIYQHYAKWTAFIKATAFMSAFFCFLGEPFAVWLDLYQLISWKHYYGFPLYILYGVILKLAVEKLKSIQRKNE